MSPQKKSPVVVLRDQVHAQLHGLTAPASPEESLTTATRVAEVVRSVGLTPVMVGVHGSHLHGCASETSDLDVFAVVAEKEVPNMQVVSDVDLRLVSLSAYLDETMRGGHQPVEWLLSKYTWRDPAYAPLLAALRPSVYRFCASARKAMAESEFRSGMSESKLARLRARFTWEDEQMRDYGGFDPSLSPVRTV